MSNDNPVEKTMAKAKYKQLDDGTYYGEVVEFTGGNLKKIKVYETGRDKAPSHLWLGVIFLNKPEIIDELAERMGCKKKDARLMIKCFQDLVMDALMRGDTVCLNGFGHFEIRIIPPRISGLTKRHVGATKTPVFKPSQKFKRIINDSSGNI